MLSIKSADTVQQDGLKCPFRPIASRTDCKSAETIQHSDAAVCDSKEPSSQQHVCSCRAGRAAAGHRGRVHVRSRDAAGGSCSHPLARAVATLYPRAVVADRSARSGGRPEPDGSFFIVHDTKRETALPGGIVIRPRAGSGPFEGDMPFGDSSGLPPSRGRFSRTRCSPVAAVRGSRGPCHALSWRSGSTACSSSVAQKASTSCATARATRTTARARGAVRADRLADRQRPRNPPRPCALAATAGPPARRGLRPRSAAAVRAVARRACGTLPTGEAGARQPSTPFAASVLRGVLLELHRGHPRSRSTRPAAIALRRTVPPAPPRRRPRHPRHLPARANDPEMRRVRPHGRRARRTAARAARVVLDGRPTTSGPGQFKRRPNQAGGYRSSTRPRRRNARDAASSSSTRLTPSARPSRLPDVPRRRGATPSTTATAASPGS